MIELDGGIKLPLPTKAKGFSRPNDVPRSRWDKEVTERWTRAYQHCLYSVFNHFHMPLHSVVPSLSSRMLEATSPMHVSLRFIGEMEIAGYLKLDKGWNKRTVTPTKKLLRLKLDADAPKSAVKLPTTSKKEIARYAIPIRGGISSNSNKEVVGICRDMSRELFEVNLFVFKLIQAFPPTDLKSSGKYMFDRLVSSCNKMLGLQFMFQYFLDSRSRMYDDTTCGMSPQGADHEKAVCLPVYKEVLTEDGFKALIEAAHGYSEISWDAQDIASMARDPAKWEDVWKEADKPYCFMACADLIRSYLDDPSIPLPAFIPLDGRCSGLQHWSALVRSNAITRHLGMHKEEDKLDIYEKVASDWEVTLEDEWKFMATRKAAKIPTMTWGYSATVMTSVEWMHKLFGAAQKWDTDLEEFILIGDGLKRSTTAKKGGDLYKRLNITLAPLKEAVNWLCHSAGKISNKGNIEIKWVTPDGFTAVQRKVKGERLDLECKLSDGEVTNVAVLDFSVKKPNTDKHRSAIAPNIIHSLDATHLRMVATKLSELGLPMIFIHDSFATHVNHRELLYKIIIDTFIELYSGDYLSSLKDYWELEYEVELSSLPEKGDWNPESIRGLTRFFV